jgi:putative transposase
MVSLLELDNNNHSVFLLWFHLVLVIKYRRRVLDNPISQRLKEIFEYIAKNYNIYLHEWNHDIDHIHCLFRTHPNTQLSKFINAYKSASSRLVKKEYPTIKKHLWKEYFWSQSFCLLTTGGAPVEIVKQYIQSQGNHEKN